MKSLATIVAIIIVSCSSTSRTQAAELTAYPGYSHLCVAFITGYEHRGTTIQSSPTIGLSRGDCRPNVKPLVVGVTHENEQNSHKGAANNEPGRTSYMADFNYDSDFGRWLDLKLVDEESQQALILLLDTLHYHKTNVTGWPLQYGHLFVGIADSTFSSTLDNDLIVELDIRLIEHSASNGAVGPYNGSRVVLGSTIDWQEQPPRLNRTHFIEIDLLASPGFSLSYNERDRPACHDRQYDRCFYDKDGRFAEGREIALRTTHGAEDAALLGRWTHIRLDLTDIVRGLRWVSPPAFWNNARMDGFYIGIESTGRSLTSIEVKNYHLYATD